MKKLDTICIMCPMGCNLTVEESGGKVTVSGNLCKRGEAYGVQELTEPKRIVTTLVRLADGGVVSAKTDGTVKKDMIKAVLEEVRLLSPSRPIKIGDILLEDIADSGVNLVATKNME